jgi:hypothetical protein
MCNKRKSKINLRMCLACQMHPKKNMPVRCTSGLYGWLVSTNSSVRCTFWRDRVSKIFVSLSIILSSLGAAHRNIQSYRWKNESELIQNSRYSTLRYKKQPVAAMQPAVLNLNYELCILNYALNSIFVPTLNLDVFETHGTEGGDKG